MQLDVTDKKGSKSTLNQAQVIARAEMVRRRRRLGKLTREQESAIEALLMSTVFKAAETIEPVWNLYSQTTSLGDVADSAKVVRFQ